MIGDLYEITLTIDMGEPLQLQWVEKFALEAIKQLPIIPRRGDRIEMQLVGLLDEYKMLWVNLISYSFDEKNKLDGIYINLTNEPIINN